MIKYDIVVLSASYLARQTKYSHHHVEVRQNATLLRVIHFTHLKIKMCMLWVVFYTSLWKPVQPRITYNFEVCFTSSTKHNYNVFCGKSF